MLADHSPLRGLWRVLLSWKYRLFQRHRHRRLVLERVGDVPILVLPDVFNPKLFRTGQALAEYLSGVAIHPGMKVLDLGTGSGVGAVFAARLGAKVVATDINPAAIRCARINILLNGVDDRVDVREGDLFEPVEGERFHLVLFNPPYYRGAPRDAWEYAWRSEGLLEQFILRLPDVLAEDGRAFIMTSTDLVDGSVALDNSGLEPRVVWERDLINERLAILEIRSGSPVQPEARIP
jgi:HemK-related putative methylase